MKVLFPPLQHYAIYDFPVDDVHTLHVREYGNKQGLPVIFLHGGPGSGCKPDHARFFHPDKYRIILYDQRGCGLSTPSGELNANTTWDLVDDLEKLRLHLGIEQWLVFAGSWGATLALAYAQTYPDHISGMILRGAFLAREKDIDWFFSAKGVARMFPQAWEMLSSVSSDTESDKLISSYYQRLLDADPGVASEAASAWSAWGDAVVTNTDSETNSQKENTVSAATLAKVRIEAHYAHHRYFLEDNQLIDQCGRLPDAPIVILHGRQDMVCTPESAYVLHRAIPGSRLEMVDSGHLASTANMIDVLVNTTDAFAS